MTTPLTDEDEFSELVDANIPRVDLVDAPANGTPGFLLMKRADGAGLVSPDQVRELIGKAATDSAPAEQVTVTGSPAAIAKLIHQAAIRDEHISKADMSTADVNDLPDSAFAYIEPGGKKDDEGKTTPRSLRHFPINDEAHVRNALSRAPQSPFGDKAMPAIRRAAKKFGIEVSKMVDLDSVDLTEPLAEPEEKAPGSPTDPGSPAWEAIDAATARQWTAVLARAKTAVELLAAREYAEAGMGGAGGGCCGGGCDCLSGCTCACCVGSECCPCYAGTPTDYGHAMDMQDAADAIDYAISLLAPFAVAEQAEADMGEVSLVGKALAGFDPAPLDTITAYAQLRKAGRVLSTANETAIRQAVESLQQVLASLPAAPVAKTAKEGGTMSKADKAVKADGSDAVEEAAGTVEECGKEAAVKALPNPQTSAEAVTAAGGEPKMGIAKADDVKPSLRAVYDAKGHLIGVVDPGDITPIADASGDDGDDDNGSDEGDGADGAAAPTDLTPAPAAEVGTPADDVHDGVAKTTNPTNNSITSDAVLKSITDAVRAAFDQQSATQEQTIAKQAEALAQMAETVETLKGRLAVVEEQPAAPKVFTNGAIPPADQLRGQDRGAPTTVDVTKARELKQTLYRGTAPEQNDAFTEMQKMAIAGLEELHQRPTR